MVAGHLTSEVTCQHGFKQFALVKTLIEHSLLNILGLMDSKAGLVTGRFIDMGAIETSACCSSKSFFFKRSAYSK